MIPNITKISTLKPLTEVIEKLTPKTLLIFDIDEVLIVPTPAFRLTHPYRKSLIQDLQKRLPYEERKVLFSIILNHCEYQLVDPSILNIIEKIKNRKIPAIALTKSFNGKLGIVDSVSDKMIGSLKKLQINFEDLSPFKEELSISEMIEGEVYPIFKKGILMTAKLDKGEALKYLLQNNNYRPSQIFFIDNQRDNLLSVQRTCESLSISFQGFEYDGATCIPEPCLSKEEERLRFKTLEEEHRWITNLISS